jgi:hypothetical protein
MTCAAEAGSKCRGIVTLRLPRAGAKAAAAANRGRIVGRKRFAINAGKVGTVRVHMSRRGRLRVLANRRARCSVAVASSAADGTRTVRRQTVTIDAGGKR